MDQLLNTAPCGFLSFTDDGTIRQINTTLLQLLGYERDELQGAHVETVLTRGARIFYQTHFFPVLKLQGKAEEIYFSLSPKNGDSIPVLVNAVRHEREGEMANDCIFVVTHQRNEYVDEILQAKKAAEEASSAKAKFLSMISHELRTPLSSINGYTEILGMEVHGPITPEQREDLQRITNASSYLLGLLNDILNFAQAEAGRVEIRPETVVVHSVLTRAESLVAPRLQEQNLALEIQHCEDLEAHADPQRLQQILLNLLTNAVKFTPAGGRVTVVCEYGENAALIHVSDTGCGIPADQIHQVFDPFVQIDNLQTETAQRGVGLGLAISRELARAMNGDLTVESTVGVGSTFTISLPLAK